jgi:hypothetical protein
VSGSPDGPSRGGRMLTWFVLALSVVLTVLGVYWYGWSSEVHERFWTDIAERVHGPMTFRFYLQPTMAAIAAYHDGVKDVRSGHKAFFWTALWDRTQPTGRIREGLNSTARIMLLGICMDVIYQFKVLDSFYPAEAVVIALLLAVLPYFVLRWVIERVARWRLGRRLPSSVT